MKLAYCYFGLLRTSDACLNTHLKNLPLIKESDTFVHTWYQHKVTSYWHGSSKESYLNVIKKLKNFHSFNIKKILIQEQFEISGNESVLIQGENIYWKSGVYLWSTVLASAKLLKKHVELTKKQYDRIIFIRPDLFLKRNLDISLLEKNIDFLFCGSILDSKNTQITYRCEDLIFSIRFTDLEKFINFCNEKINEQKKMEHGYLPNNKNYILDYCINNDLNYEHLNYLYEDHFEIRRNYSYLSKVLKWVKNIFKKLFLK